MLIGAIEAQLNIINYELKFTLDNGHFITGVEIMGFYYAILVILFIIIILSLILNLLTNPIVWLTIIVLIIWSAIRKYMYKKKIEEFNKEFEEKVEQTKQAYYQDTYDYHDDVIDVDYKEYDDK